MMSGNDELPDERKKDKRKGTSSGEAQRKIARKFHQYRSQNPKKYRDKNVTVTSFPAEEREKICLTAKENREVVPLTVKNFSSNSVEFEFWTCDMVSNIFTFEDHGGETIKTIKGHTLGAGEVYNIKVLFHSEDAGFYEQLLVFEFKSGQQPSDGFEIMRLLQVQRCKSLGEEFSPAASHSSLIRTSVSEIPFCAYQNVVLVSRSSLSVNRLKTVKPLKDYKMKFIDQKTADTDLQTLLQNLEENYSERFHLLLSLQELQLQRDIKKYKMESETMFRDGSLFILKVPGVSEKRPSLLPRDMVKVCPLGQAGSYMGTVTSVDPEQEKVYLEFSAHDRRILEHFHKDMKFSVEFTVNRLILNILHRALDEVSHILKPVLFPSVSARSDQQHELQPLSLFNPQLEKNPEQKKAVQHILAGSSRPAPYLVFGPPGTGKTVTLVEAIKQLQRRNCNILACAPSNSATDLLCEKILAPSDSAEEILNGDPKKHKVLRFYALSHCVGDIPATLKPHCKLEWRKVGQGDLEKEMVVIPNREELMSYQVIVTTLVNASRLVTGGFPRDHFSYFFVDEAGQAAETECIIPLADLLEPQTGQVVLAGDPKQLGPIITSSLAKKHGLDESLMERLMNRDLYLTLNPRFITKLLQNYRSHPDILEIPNKLFYGDLKPCADKEICNSYCKWDHLRKTDFPVIFHGVAGSDERHENSTSLFNMAEVDVVVGYLKKIVLQTKGVTQIGPKDIGIIAPYRKQVEKIRIAIRMDKALRAVNLKNVLIGTVEEFQGKEFKAILVSTVRSNPKLTEPDKRCTLGFVNNKKRFNVALTRAQALLIVVGDPRVLQTDENWDEFIRYCYQRGGYDGIEVDAVGQSLLDAVKKLSVESGESDPATAGPVLRKRPHSQEFSIQH